MPAADEVGKLERGKGPVSDFYRKIAKRHIKGLGTTQGTYIVAPGGKLIDSRHTYDLGELADLLKSTLEKYKALPKKERLGKRTGTRTESSDYPEDGLVLSVLLRKFYKRKPQGRQARGVVEWNQDFAWYRKDEARRFLPSRFRKGGTHEVPGKLVERLARFHLINTVRAFADPFPSRCVKEARLKATVLEVEGNTVTLRFDGAIHSAQDNTPKYGSSKDPGRLPRNPVRHFKADLLGYATFDRRKNVFTKFELVALGTQQGGGSRGSQDPVPIGAALTLTGGTPIERVEPLHLDFYQWK